MGMPLTAHRFTVDEFHRMAAAGILREDDRVELLDGQIVEMTPIGPGHSGCVGALTALLTRQVGDTALVWVQNPVRLGEHAEPQPDVAVLRHGAGGYRTAHPAPSDVVLVIEVGDASVDSDRQTKIPIYARSGIQEAWLVNLPAGVVEIYRGPRAGRYTDIRTARRGETLTPLQLPSIRVRVDDILG